MVQNFFDFIRVRITVGLGCILYFVSSKLLDLRHLREVTNQTELETTWADLIGCCDSCAIDGRILAYDIWKREKSCSDNSSIYRIIKTGGVTLEHSRWPLTMSKTEGGYWYHVKYFCPRNQSLFAATDCSNSSLPILNQEKNIFRNETIFTTTRTKKFNKTTGYDILSCQIYFKTILLSVRYKISKKKDERGLRRLDHCSLKHR